MTPRCLIAAHRAAKRRAFQSSRPLTNHGIELTHDSELGRFDHQRIDAGDLLGHHLAARLHAKRRRD